MEVLQLFIAYALGYGPLVVVGLALPVLAIGGSGLLMSRQEWLLFGFVAILLLFGQSTWGMLEVSRPIYTRGVGQLFFPFIVWGLWGLAAFAMLRSSFSGAVAHTTNLRPVGFAFLLFFLGNIVVGLFLEIDISDILNSSGLINFFHITVFVFVLTSLLQTRRELRTLLLMAGGLIVARGVYGFVRWAAFGGDPANVYANIEHSAVKLTFFDICDNMIACLVLAYALSWLVTEWKKHSFKLRLAVMSVAALELLVIVFSYRRTAWIGLLIVLLWIFITAPIQAKRVLWLGFPPLFAGVGVLAAQRLSKLTHGATGMDQFFHDLQAKSGSADTRFTELGHAFQSFLDYPIFGLGSWGRFSGGHFGWHTGENAYTFVHSGPVHLLFKTGLVGTSLFVFAVCLVASHVFKWRKRVALRDRYVIDSCIAGALFMLPDFLMGTPIPQFRTMMLYGLLIAVPYVVVGISNRENQASA